MNGSLWLDNLIAYNLQVGVLALLGTVLPWLLRLCHPRVLLAYWQALLLSVLLLPFLQPWQQSRVILPALPEPSPMVPISALPAATAPGASGPTLAQVVLVVLTGGMLVRGLWVAVGFLRLRTLRRRSRPLVPLPEAVRRMREQLGVFPGFRVSDEVSGPVTFGILQPTILFPGDFESLDPSSQQALACHELMHVRRGDWLFTAVEEFIRVVFWFHPAVWWLVERIQSAREQVVDREVVQVTAARPAYLEALLKVAENRFQFGGIPAPLFLRERQLAYRVALMLQEVSMSRKRLILSLSCMIVLALAGVFLAVRAFPLTAAPVVLQEAKAAETEARAALQNRTSTTERRSHSEEHERPAVVYTGAAQPQREHPIRVGGNVQATKLIHQVEPVYPDEALKARVAGIVLVETHINEAGEVWALRLLRGHPLLNGAAIEAVSQWRYSPTTLNGEPVPVLATTALRFSPGEKPGLTSVQTGQSGRPGLVLHMDQSGIVWEGTQRLEGAELLARVQRAEGTIELRVHPFLPQQIVQETLQLLGQASGREIRSIRGF